MELKDFTVSSELLSEVLKLEVVKHSLFNKSSNTFNVTYMQSEDSLKANWMLVNIYEFAFKCKEWALKQGYIMKIENHYSNSIQIQIRKNISSSKYLEPWKKTFKSEVESIIKACEWILKERI